MQGLSLAFYQRIEEITDSRPKTELVVKLIEEFSEKELPHLIRKEVAKMDLVTNTNLNARINTLEQSIDTRFDNLEQSVDARFNKLEQSIDARFKLVDARFDNLEQSVDARFNKLEQSIDARFKLVDARFDKLEQSIDARFDNVMRELQKINITLLEISRFNVEINTRVSKIEGSRMTNIKWIEAMKVLVYGVVGSSVTLLIKKYFP